MAQTLFACAEVKLLLDGLSHNLLKLISSEGLSDVLPNLIKYLKPGMLFEGTVLKSFPDKNKAIIQLDKRQVIVETRQPLTPGNSFSARVEKTSPQTWLTIITQNTQQVTESPQFETKAQLPDKQYSDITNLKTHYQRAVPGQLTSSDIQNLNLTIGQSTEAKIIHISSRTTAIATIRDKEVTFHFKAGAPPKPGTIVKLTVEPFKQNLQVVAQKCDFAINNEGNLQDLHCSITYVFEKYLKRQNHGRKM